jgi:hypothetical protein
MPNYTVKLAGDAWVELVATVYADDETEAVEKARMQGRWRIVGDVKIVTTEVKLNVQEAGD